MSRVPSAPAPAVVPGARAPNHPGPVPVLVTGRIASGLVALAVVLFGALIALGSVADTLTASFVVCGTLLPPAFVAMTAALAMRVEGDRRIWGGLAVAFATVYVVPCTTCYALQIFVVRGDPLSLGPDLLRALAFAPGSAAFALDMVGYGFMALSSLFLGLALGSRELRGLRAANLVHGALFLPTWVTPALPFPPPGDGPGLDAGGVAMLAWCLLFLPIPLLAFRSFRDTPRGGPQGRPPGQQRGSASMTRPYRSTSIMQHV